MTQQDDRDRDRSVSAEGDLSTADLADREPQRPRRENNAQDNARSGDEDRSEPLFPADEVQDLRARWDSIQTGFVDEPRRAVEEADTLVATAMKQLAESFADERRALESQWDRGDDVSTEDLRLALRRYRSFFGRLLSM
jgi:hypothetical protein